MSLFSCDANVFDRKENYVKTCENWKMWANRRTMIFFVPHTLHPPQKCVSYFGVQQIKSLRDQGPINIKNDKWQTIRQTTNRRKIRRLSLSPINIVSTTDLSSMTKDKFISTWICRLSFLTKDKSNDKFGRQMTLPWEIIYIFFINKVKNLKKIIVY